MFIFQFKSDGNFLNSRQLKRIFHMVIYKTSIYNDGFTTIILVNEYRSWSIQLVKMSWETDRKGSWIAYFVLWQP